MTDILNNCSVCLDISTSLVNITKTDANNISWCTKLSCCVSEVEWKENYLICRQCAEKLEAVNSFRKMCIQSDITRKNELSKVANSQSTTAEQSLSNPTDDTKLESDCEDEQCDNDYNINDDETSPENSDIDMPEDLFVELEREERRLEQTAKQAARRRRFSDFACDSCGAVFPSSKKVIAHAIEVHKIPEKDVKPYVCEKCGNKFRHCSNLLRHRLLHEERRNICTYCGKGFITKYDLSMHEKIHLHKREYTCNLCPKNFNTRKNLGTHKLICHTDPILWHHQCNICEKRFPIKSGYLTHMRRHAGDKRFACHMCEKRFVDKIVLQKHMLSHSNVCAFKCDICGKEYKHKQVLDIHLARVHNVGNAKVPSREKKHFCDVCPKSYCDKNKLTRHMLVHTGEKPYSCNLCGKKFTDNSYVKQHMKNVHNVYEDA